MISRITKSCLQAFGVLAALFVLWLFVAAREMQSFAPPPNAKSLSAFADVMPEPTRLVQINDGGTTKFIWVGDTAIWALPSGPSCYVFDSDGKLVEWDASTGDGERTTRYLQLAWDGNPLTVEHAISLASGT